MSAAPDRIPASLRAPKETPEQRLNRRMATAMFLRRRRLEAGLTFRQVALATQTDASRLSRYEQGWQYPGPSMVERIMAAIARLDAEGAGNLEKAAQAKAEYAEADAEAAGSTR